jgi:hypothetical protein
MRGSFLASLARPTPAAALKGDGEARRIAPQSDAGPQRLRRV